VKHGDEWITSRGDLAPIAEELDFSKHFQIVSSVAARRLRHADRSEIEAGKSWSGRRSENKERSQWKAEASTDL